MSVQDVRFDGAVNWPSNALSEVPFRVYTDPQQYALEQETIFKGESWSYLCLASEVANPGDWVATTVGEVAVIVARDDVTPEFDEVCDAPVLATHVFVEMKPLAEEEIYRREDGRIETVERQALSARE